MALKPGYKQTEAGVIPEDWEVKSIGDISEVKTGPFGTALHEKDYVIDGTPIITVEHLGEYGVDHRNLPMVSDEDKKRLKSYTLQVGDIAFSRVGSIDRNALIRERENGWLFSGRLLRVRVNNEKYDSSYLSYHFHSESFKQRVQSVAVGQTMPSLNTTILKGIKIVLPETAEQTAIANALSDADALIQSLTSLIAKKRQIKQGTMQTLLNPYENGRLKAEWVVKKLGEITDLLTGFPFSSLGYTNEGIRLLRGSNIKRGQTDWTDEITKCWPSMTSDIRRYELLEGDIVVAMDGSLVGRSFAQLKQSDLPALLLQRVARIRSKSESFDINYIKEWVCSEIFTKHCDSLKTVTAIPHISPADIYNFVLNVPEQKEEQTRIATILSGMDAEIATLETKLAKYRHIKQGMMQNLLTGRIRLVQPGSNTGAVA